MTIPEWFWAVEYLLAPFLVGVVAIGVSIWMFIQSQRSNQRQLKVWERIAEALERRGTS